MTEGTDRRHDDRYYGRRGNHRSSVEREQRHFWRGERWDYWRMIVGITGGGEHQYNWRGPLLAGSEWVSVGLTGGESPTVTERQEEELLEGLEQVLPDGSSAGITRVGDCRHNHRRQVLIPALFPPVTPTIPSSSNACSRPLLQLLRSPLWSFHVRGSRGAGREFFYPMSC